MNAIAVVRTSAVVYVRCVSCGDHTPISDRQHRNNVREQREHRCRLCRTLTRVRKPTPAENERYRNYWRTRFTMDEIREMAGAIWG